MLSLRVFSRCVQGSRQRDPNADNRKKHFSDMKEKMIVRNSCCIAAKSPKMELKIQRWTEIGKKRCCASRDSWFRFKLLSILFIDWSFWRGATSCLLKPDCEMTYRQYIGGLVLCLWHHTAPPVQLQLHSDSGPANSRKWTVREDGGDKYRSQDNYDRLLALGTTGIFFFQQCPQNPQLWLQLHSFTALKAILSRVIRAN